MEISLATTKDLQGILALQDQIYRIKSLPKNAQQILTKLVESEDCDVLVAKNQNQVVGSAIIFYLPIPAHEAPCAFLEGLVVDKSRRGQGLGTALFKEAVKLSKKRGAYKILFTSGFDRTDAHRLYQKLGFSKWGFEFRKNLK